MLFQERRPLTSNPVSWIVSVTAAWPWYETGVLVDSIAASGRPQRVLIGSGRADELADAIQRTFDADPGASRAPT